MKHTINVLVDTFIGLSLPRTLCLPLSGDSTTEDLLDAVAARLPVDFCQTSRASLTTVAGRRITSSTGTTVSALSSSLPSDNDVSSYFLPLRLSVPLVGGKGGFGSQLRAAGGRMSSRKKRQNAELATGSARNLDGRRLRTITEAKNLATYLATKPEMDRKEKEERRKRWEQIVELAEQREADMRAGKGADGRRKGLSDEWIEMKEEVTDNVRNAIRMAMMAEDDAQKSKKGHPDAGDSSGSGGSGPASDDSEDEDLMELDEGEMSRLRVEAEAGDADALWVLQNRLKIPLELLPKHKKPVRKFAGFDDDEDSSENEAEVEDEEGAPIKGKQNPSDNI
jgi:hypothetical protein